MLLTSHNLMKFNHSISLAMAKAIQHLSDYLTLARRDVYLDHLKSGIKQDTGLSQKLPVHLATRFKESPSN